jgi:hypothetical protein
MDCERKVYKAQHLRTAPDRNSPFLFCQPDANVTWLYRACALSKVVNTGPSGALQLLAAHSKLSSLSNSEGACVLNYYYLQQYA